MTRNEAIKKVRQMSLPKETMEILQALAPELAESEDERIRKFLVNEVLGHIGMLDIEGDRVVNNTRNELWKKALAYLEKQKEQKPAEWSEEDEQTINVAIETLEHENYLILAKRLKSLRSRPKSSDNLPKWKNASAGTKLPSESVIRAEGQDPRFGSVAVYDCEYITIKELGKLPKEE